MYAYPLYFVLFGLVLTAVLGLLASWLDRKVTARVQYRVGPPVLQPAIDIVKLLGKETLIPAGAHKPTFLAAPLFSFAGAAAVSTLLWITVAQPSRGFAGDVFVALYLFTMPSLGIILGGFASGNPVASLGASREMKLILAYELPFVIALFVPIILSGYAIRLPELAAYQAAERAFVLHPSGLLAFLVALLCTQAKMGLVPFDVAEAETEITGGPLIEYSGPGLAVYRLSKNMLFIALPLFLVLMFLGGIPLSASGIAYGVLKLVLVIALLTLIRNTNPRIRIDQAMCFFWVPVTGVALAAVVFAMFGW
ncbi:MAG TPA: NADH-quinone oxidoreductase subunit H [Candidatus Hydrogenedentes bacterium]|nr:NADH-quinone oxidoreductase subunit H [Candidatus Hydrogenedentota bacterium]HQH53561.1 NADH-quinone oxidoreductase subunit H [Candidatus Hydrogenedentota bacterium]